MIYKAIRGSGDAVLKNDITEIETEIEVLNKEKLPLGPSILTLDGGEDSESIYYVSISSTGVLEGVRRGYGGSTARNWDAGTSVRRVLTSTEWDRLVDTLYDNLDYADEIETDGGNVISITRKKDGEVVQKFIYGYDVDGRIVAETLEKYAEGYLLYSTLRTITYDMDGEVVGIVSEVL